MTLSFPLIVAIGLIALIGWALYLSVKQDAGKMPEYKMTPPPARPLNKGAKPILLIGLPHEDYEDNEWLEDLLDGLKEGSGYLPIAYGHNGKEAVFKILSEKVAVAEAMGKVENSESTI